MKHLIKNFAISCIDGLGMTTLYRFFVKRKGPLVRIVVFHDVADAVWFESVIQMLVKDFHCITPEDFHLCRLETEKINVLITFDDGYQSWIDTCTPVLAKYSVKGLFFINSGLLDSASEEEKVVKYMRERLLVSPKKPLTWEGASQLLSQGHTLGGHTVGHYNLATLSTPDALEEIVSDKQKIESQFGVTLSDFAYPFGQRTNWNETIFGLVIQAGYTFVYTAQSGFVENKHTNAIRRVCLEKDQSLESIRSWILGGYDIFSSLKR